ncbi:unnamed protein product [Acidithrix sp. C25]|nr:unnamed protein product [Acidithrix sp. C25]
MRHLTQGLAWQGTFSDSWQVQSKAGIYKARVKLGSAPMAELYKRVAKLLAIIQTKGTF